MAASSSFSSSSSSSSSASMGLDTKQLHVLVVDDSLLDRKLTEMLLIKNACKVTTKENGIKALEFLGLADGQDTTKNNDQVNLIITDYHMPRMTGFELLKKIKESPTTKAIPIVILSSEKEDGRVDECMKEGAHQFIQKPLKQSDFAQLLGTGDKGPL